MTEGPTRREIDRVREALERHDTELQDDEPREPQEPAAADTEEDDEG
jgi:hypothetical protein